jgi:CBS domain-containing protein
MNNDLRVWMHLCEFEQGTSDHIRPFKVGDWVYSDIAKDTGHIRQHHIDDALDYYTVRWSDDSETNDVPQGTLQAAGTPTSPKPPAAAKSPAPTPPQHAHVSNVIKGRKAIIVFPTASIFIAAKLIAKHNVGALMVLNGRSLAGILSERDIVSKVIARGLNVESTLVSQIMTAHPVTISSGDLLTKALKLMNDGGFRHLPIVNGGDVVGLLSLRDAMLPALWGSEGTV